MKKQAKQKQQGDVLFRRVRKTKLSRGNIGRHVLAEGEHTGHAHVIDADDQAELIREGERMLLRLTKPATVRHEEHNPVLLEPGVWEVGRVREVDHLNGLVRQVTD